MIIYGDPKVGKSFAALQLADAVQNGTSWLGFPCRKGKVVYLQLDTPRNVWQTRVRSLAEIGAMSNLPTFADRETLNAWPFDILNPEHLIMLREELQAAKADLVIFDTLRESHSADENDSTEMQAAIAAIVAATQGAAIALISHSRKPNQDGAYNLMNDNRGSSYVVGRMDAIVRFTPKTVRISSRSIEEHTIETERLDNGFWEAINVEQDRQIDSLLADAQFTSVRAKAKVLSLANGKSESACRALLRRRMANR